MSTNRPWFRRDQPQPSGVDVSIPVDVSMAATVTPAAQVLETLYRNGRPVHVPLADVDAWLTDGFTRAPVDVGESIAAYRLKWYAALQTGEAYIAETLAKGHIRREEGATKHLAERAHADAAQAWLDLHNALQLTYRTLEEGQQP